MNSFKLRFFVKLILILIIQALFIQHSYAGLKPNELYKATYKGKHLGIPVTITRTLVEQKDSNFKFQLKAEGFPGSITETSFFAFNDNSLKPFSYKYKQRLFGIEKKRSVAFDWESKQAYYKKDGKLKKTHELTKGIQDQSLYQLQLLFDLNQKSETFDYDFIRKSRKKSMQFHIVTKDQFYFLGEKKYPAWRVEVVRKKEEKQKTVFTVIPELYFQIAEITQIEKDGSSYKVSLTNIEINDDKTRKFFKLSE